MTAHAPSRAAPGAALSIAALTSERLRGRRTQADVVTLQRALGNAVAVDVLRPIGQASLVGPAGDPLEVEAERNAERIVRAEANGRQDNRSEPDQATRSRSEGTRPVQRKAVAHGARDSAPIGAAGGSIPTGVARQIEQARGHGRPLHETVRRSMEDRFSADFSSVRVHTGTAAAALNSSIGASGFTTGRDLFFGDAQYQPDSARGRRLIAHELTHVVQQRAVPVRGNRALRICSSSGSAVVQRAFHPAAVIHNAHLRNSGAWSKRIGERIDSGSQIVVDKAARQNQKNETWVKAVDETASGFDPAVHGSANTYIRASRVGADKDYGPKGIKVDVAGHQPPKKEARFQSFQLQWLPTVGEYVEIEESVSVPGALIVHEHGNYRRLAAGALHNLDGDETLQLNTVAVRTHFHDRVKGILQAASAAQPWSDKLSTDKNVDRIVLEFDPETKEIVGSRALRMEKFVDNPFTFVPWFRWASAPNGPLKRIQDGAVDATASLDHWREHIYPADKNRVVIGSINLTGSDLHEHGLGVMLVSFTKPRGGHAAYSAAGQHEVVVKPEVRALELAMFGTQQGSLANTINRAVGIVNLDEQIRTYRQDIDDRYGTLCQKVIGSDLKHLPTGGNPQVVSQAFKEAIVFIMLTGLSDQHGENVLWDDRNRPYMIDADNALKLRYMTTDTSREGDRAAPTSTHLQAGFTWHVKDRGDEVITGIMRSSRHYETSIMDALTNPASPEQRRLLLTVRDTLRAHTGRTVPIETGVWGERLRVFIGCAAPGTQHDVPVDGVEPTTRWGWCKRWATTVPTGQGAQAPGLEGEVGRRAGTNGNFKPAREASQIHADFTVGQIPFYNYVYRTGHVLHNGQRIWDGQRIGERMAGLFALFPRQARR